MLTISSLTKYFGTVKAVDSLSLTLKPGEILGLVGPNGAGKTTTLRCACGILTPDAGTITVGEYDLVKDDLAAKRLLAFIPEMPTFYDLLTVHEQLRFIAMSYDTVDEFERTGDELLERYDLKEKENSLIVGLSKGMKQKLAITAALIHKASVFLCDEPMIGLDPQGQHSFKRELQRLRSDNCAVIVSTHILATAQDLCDRLVIMQTGRKIFEGTMDELRRETQMHSKSLEEIFLKLTTPDDT